MMESWRATAAAAANLRPNGEPIFVQQGARLPVSSQADDKTDKIFQYPLDTPGTHGKDGSNTVKHEHSAEVPAAVVGNDDGDYQSVANGNDQHQGVGSKGYSVVKDEVDEITSSPAPPPPVASGTQIKPHPPIPYDLDIFPEQKPPVTSMGWARTEAETNAIIERYGMMVAMQDDFDGQPRWLACKFCAAFGFERRPVETPEQMYTRPFVEKEMSRHAAVEHSMLWPLFNVMNDRQKADMFTRTKWRVPPDELVERARERNQQHQTGLGGKGSVEANSRRAQKRAEKNAEKEEADRQWREGPNGEEYRAEKAKKGAAKQEKRKQKKAARVQRKKDALLTPEGQAKHREEEQKRAARREERRGEKLRSRAIRKRNKRETSQVLNVIKAEMKVKQERTVIQCRDKV